MSFPVFAGLLCCHGGRLITGSAGGSVRLWSTVGVGELKLPGEHHSMRRGGLTMEDEMALDGAVVSAAFDETLDMGIVGTVVGTLWYINWTERTSIRLVSGHMSKVRVHVVGVLWVWVSWVRSWVPCGTSTGLRGPVSGWCLDT